MSAAGVVGWRNSLKRDIACKNLGYNLQIGMEVKLGAINPGSGSQPDFRMAGLYKLVMVKILICFLSLLLGSFSLFSQSTVNRQKNDLEDILKINIAQKNRENTRRTTWQDSTWSDWLKRSGELPPDFSSMAHMPFLPDPLVQLENGKEKVIKSKADWAGRREWIKKEYQRWVSGTPPPTPDGFKVSILSDRIESGTRIQMVRLNFGPGYKAKMTLELMTPKGNGPFPVYMTQWTHRGWAQLAVRRGYMACVYAAADSKDDTEEYQKLYPDYDFSMLMRRAWGASRVIDYLETLQNVNKQQIAITGHSRNGKQSLWAAAFDERIAAVVSTSSSTGGDSPWRFGDPQYASETLDLVTAYNGHWFHPRLRFFFGREDQLPVDQNLLGALIAPRALLYHYSVVERGLNPWAIEQNYYSVKKVYDFLGAGDNIGVFSRYGEHALAARDLEYAIDFLDIHFKRRNLSWRNNLYYEYDYLAWEKEHSKDKADAAKIKPVFLKDNYGNVQAFDTDKTNIINNLNWILGSEPSGVKPTQMEEALPARRDWLSQIIGLPEVPGAKFNYFGPYTAMGDHVNGVLYYPVDATGKMKLPASGKIPVIVYSHQYAHSTGFARGYDKYGGNGTVMLFKELIDSGFAVLAMDTYGFGTRIEEAQGFYTRTPDWSKMGKYISDIKGSIDGLETLEYVDKKHIYLLGNTLGGSISLMTAALDQRVAGVATVAAFSPWRTSNKQYESLKTHSHLHGNIPRLGFFAARPMDAPVDFGEIIAAIAPRPAMIIAPGLDRYTDITALKATLAPVFKVYGLYRSEANLVTKYPHEINRMTEDMYKEVSRFFTGLLKEESPARNSR